jgi:GTP-binding protein Era
MPMTADEHTVAPGFRCGYVAIIGEPNVGKSTLMNSVLGQKLSIVTPKPQTTRHRILGIHSTDAAQIIFLDTPGIIKPRYLLHEVMMDLASLAIEEADLLHFMIDATAPATAEGLTHDEAFGKLQGLSKAVFLVINKVDLVPKTALLPMIAFYAEKFPFREIFPVSALRSDGVTELVRATVAHLPEHPPFYPLDIVSDHQERFFVGEMIREKIFMKCQEEVPYATTVDIVEFKEREEGKWFISADIYVERDSQKGILIGRKGSMLKEIGLAARREIERFLDHPVFLDLHVKVREKWREDEAWLGRLGYSPRKR